MQGIQFNGNGTFTVPFGTVNIGGFAVIDISGGVGTYTVAADCTGTLSVTDGPSFNMYVGPGAPLTEVGRSRHVPCVSILSLFVAFGFLSFVELLIEPS
jgi:hypothetical protein